MSTATVETLTAEVRVLMVGNRQVTLSVYRQLDQVPLLGMDPFGRVRDGKDEGTWVVGRSKEGGVLVRAFVEPEPYATEIYADELSGKVTFCSPLWPGANQPPKTVTFRGRRVRFARELVEYCDHHRRDPRQKCGTWSANGLNEEIAAALAEEDERMAPHIEAATLPLIVLAGLR